MGETKGSQRTPIVFDSSSPNGNGGEDSFEKSDTEKVKMDFFSMKVISVTTVYNCKQSVWSKIGLQSTHLEWSRHPTIWPLSKVFCSNFVSKCCKLWIYWEAIKEEYFFVL